MESPEPRIATGFVATVISFCLWEFSNGLNILTMSKTWFVCIWDPRLEKRIKIHETGLLLENCLERAKAQFAPQIK